MTRARTLVGVMAVLGLALGPSGCSTDSGSEPSPTASSVSSIPSVAPSGPSVTPTGPTSSTSKPGDPAEADVVALIKKYYVVNTQIRNDRSVPVDRYKSVTTGKYYTILRDAVRASRLRGERASGGVKIVDGPRVTRLPSADDSTAARTVTCIDVRGAKLVDRQGRSLVAKGRSPFYVERARVIKTKSGWRVSNVTNKGAKAC